MPLSPLASLGDGLLVGAVEGELPLLPVLGDGVLFVAGLLGLTPVPAPGLVGVEGLAVDVPAPAAGVAGVAGVAGLPVAGALAMSTLFVAAGSLTRGVVWVLVLPSLLSGAVLGLPSLPSSLDVEGLAVVWAVGPAELTPVLVASAYLTVVVIVTVLGPVAAPLPDAVGDDCLGALPEAPVVPVGAGLFAVGPF